MLRSAAWESAAWESAAWERAAWESAAFGTVEAAAERDVLSPAAA